ncbi:MAG: hypothetical protein GY865_08260 [candidate division Zixibacteria bacterium]|nr:hypothetical protein [candidate division Zixibacteria bacterium]
MYKLKMVKHLNILIKVILFLGIICTDNDLLAQTSLRDSISYEIAQNIWYDRYPMAVEQIENIIKYEPDNPLGYFLLGSVYQTISEEFRNDSLKNQITENLEKAIDLAKQRFKEDQQNPDWPFICGASFGYRALHRAFHGGWWGAFQDGLKCSSYLKKALKLDSTYYDAYLGLGAYHYHKTVKSKAFLWLPFVADRREQGIEELQLCIESGFLATHSARESLLRIYFDEKQYEKLLGLADSLDKLTPFDPYGLLFYVRGLIEMNRLDEAEEKLQELKLGWKQSPYYDPIGMFEAELLMADILFRTGDTTAAERIVNTIISSKDMADDNAYFEETLAGAKKLKRKMK